MKGPVWVVVGSVLVLGAGGCVGDDHASTVLTVPGSHPAVLPAALSVGPTGGEPSGVSDRPSPELAQRFAEAGYAALRHDPPGVGQSGGAP